MTKDTTKHIRTYNITIDHAPCTTTTSEQERMMCFSIELMNTLYEATVADVCVDHKEYVTR